MPDNRHETELVIQSRVVGAQKAAQDFSRIGQAINDPSYQRSLKLLEERMTSVNEMVSNGTTNTKAFRSELAALGRETQAINRLRRAMSDLAVQRGQLSRQQVAGIPGALPVGQAAGRQGFIQGSGLGPIFQGRGPGGLQQAGGFLAGRAARGIGRAGLAAARAPFLPGGFGAAAGAIGGLLGVGQVVQGQVSAGLAQAETSLELRRAFQGLLQQTGGARGLATGDVSGAQARVAAAEAALTQEQARVQALRRSGQGGDLISIGGTVRTTDAIDDRTGDRQRDLSRARRGVRRAREFGTTNLIDQLIREGAQFGLSPQQAISVAGGAAGARRGQFEFQTAEAAFIAQRFGAGPGVAGQLGAQARLSGQGDVDFVAEQIGTAVTAGLEGSQIADFLQAVASNTDALRNQGIQFDAQAFGQLTTALSRTPGISPEQAVPLAQDITGAGRRLGLRGPQGPLDILALRTLGGLQGTSPEDLFRATGRLERGQISPEGLTSFIQQITQLSGLSGQGPEALAGITQRTLGQFIGRPVGREQVSSLIEQVQAGRLLTPQDVLGFTRDEARAAAGVGAEGPRVVDPALAEQGRIQADLNRSGNRLLEFSEQLQKAQENNLATVAEFDVSLQALATSLTQVTQALNDVVRGQGAPRGAGGLTLPGFSISEGGQ